MQKRSSTREADVTLSQSKPLHAPGSRGVIQLSSAPMPSQYKPYRLPYCFCGRTMPNISVTPAGAVVAVPLVMYVFPFSIFLTRALGVGCATRDMLTCGLWRVACGEGHEHLCCFGYDLRVAQAFVTNVQNRPSSPHHQPPSASLVSPAAVSLVLLRDRRGPTTPDLQRARR